MQKEYMTQLETQLAQLLTRSFPYLGDDVFRRRMYTYTKREVKHLVLAAIRCMYRTGSAGSNKVSPLYNFSDTTSEIQRDNGLLTIIRTSRKYPRTLLGWNTCTASGEYKCFWDLYSLGRLLLKDYSGWNGPVASPSGHTHFNDEDSTSGTLSNVTEVLKISLSTEHKLLREVLPVSKVPINIVFQKQVHCLLNFLFDPYSNSKVKGVDATLWRPSSPSMSYSINFYGQYKISFDIKDKKWMLWEL